MLPMSGQILVLETGLSLLDVIELSLSHKQESSMVWDPESLAFVGSVDSRDLLKIIISQYSESDMQLEGDAILAKLRAQTLSEWWALSSAHEFISVNADDDLFNASQLLKTNKLHRVPIIDEKQNLVVGVMSMEAILSFFIENYVADSSLFDHPLASFEIGTGSGIITAPVESTLIETLRLIADKNMSSLPIVNSENRLEGVLYLSDIPQIISSGLYLNLDTPILSVLKQVNENEDDMGFSRFGEITEDDTMKSMIQRLAASQERKLFKLNDYILEQVITESDLFGYFI